MLFRRSLIVWGATSLPSLVAAQGSFDPCGSVEKVIIETTVLMEPVYYNTYVVDPTEITIFEDITLSATNVPTEIIIETYTTSNITVTVTPATRYGRSLAQKSRC